MESDDFFAGAYKGKVLEIHTKQSNIEEDQNIQKLIAIEDPHEPTEIVIHVNKLKEGGMLPISIRLYLCVHRLQKF